MNSPEGSTDDLFCLIFVLLFMSIFLVPIFIFLGICIWSAVKEYWRI